MDFIETIFLNGLVDKQIYEPSSPHLTISTMIR